MSEQTPELDMIVTTNEDGEREMEIIYPKPTAVDNN